MIWFSIWLTWRRARRVWKLMLATAIGVLLATTLMSTAVSHSSSLATAGLLYTLDPQTVTGAHDLQVTVFNRPIGRTDQVNLDTLVNEKIQTHVGWFASGIHRDGQAQGVQFNLAPEQTHPEGAQLRFFYQEEFENHAKLIRGRWPSKNGHNVADERRTLEVVIGNLALESLERIQWNVGMSLYVFPERDDGGDAENERMKVTIVGVVGASDPTEAYWSSSGQRLDMVRLNSGSLISLYVNETDFFEVIGIEQPTLLSTYTWYVDLESTSLNSDTARKARQSLIDLQADLSQTFPRTVALSLLGDAITEYERRLALARVPLFMFISLVIGVILYYLVLISWMLARSRGNETALLRSRGASAFQVVSLLGLGEGLLLVVPAIILGPLLGTIIGHLLPVSSNYQFTDLLGGFNVTTFVASFSVGMVSIFVILLTGFLATGQNMVEFLRERSRPPGTAALYRYAIDLIALMVIGLIWWQIRGRGGLFTKNLLGEGLEADLTLLLGPGLLLLAVGLMLLRLLPYSLRLIAVLSSRTNIVWLMHGFNRMARDPLPYGALAVLLMLSSALGTFGASFGPTLTGSQTDQIKFAIGGEIVAPAQQLSPSQTPEDARTQIASMEGIGTVSPIYKGILNSDDATVAGGQASLMAVDPNDLADAIWFRNDFSDQSLEELLNFLPQDLDPDIGIPLPEGTQKLGVWVKAEEPYPDYSLWARFRDSEHEFEQFVLGELGAQEWTYLEASIPIRVHLKPPYHLVGFYVTGPNLALVGKGSIAIDNAMAVLGDNRLIIETFEESGNWESIPSIQVTQDELIIEKGGVSGNAARFKWTYPISAGLPRGIFNSPVTLPIPAIGSASYSPGQKILGILAAEAVPIEIMAVADFFPSTDQKYSTFLIVDIKTLDLYQRYLPRPRAVFPSEFWIGLQGSGNKTLTLDQLRALYPAETDIIDRDAESDRILNDPLSGGAWYGLAVMSMATLSGVALLGLTLYTVLAFRRTRLELGLLRAIGFTRRQIGFTVSLEGTLIAIVGLAVGLATGSAMGQWTLSYLGVTVSGREVIPPMAIAVDDGLIALAYGGVAFAALFSTLVAVILSARSQLAEVLRVEE